MSPAPNASQREAAYQLDLRKRLRIAEQALLARAPENDIEPSLDQITAVMELLGDPQRAFPVIHITGTNGKTSTARLVESLLRALGLRTGRFTSPHLHDIRERIALDGRPIDVEKFLTAYDNVLPFLEIVDAADAAAGRPRMNYFQALVAIGYAAFADAPVDVAVVEVGLGGTWDATNVADGQVAVVTPIAIDHTRLLGSTEVQIALEKGGIIKAGAIAIVGVQDPDVIEVLTERGEEVGARLAHEGNDFGVLTRDVAVGGQLVSLRGWLATTRICSSTAAPIRRTTRRLRWRPLRRFLAVGSNPRHRRRTGGVCRGDVPGATSRSSAGHRRSCRRGAQPGGCLRRSPRPLPRNSLTTLVCVGHPHRQGRGVHVETLEPVLAGRRHPEHLAAVHELDGTRCAGVEIFGDHRVTVIDDCRRRSTGRPSWRTRAALAAA